MTEVTAVGWFEPTSPPTVGDLMFVSWPELPGPGWTLVPSSVDDRSDLKLWWKHCANDGPHHWPPLLGFCRPVEWSE